MTRRLPLSPEEILELDEALIETYSSQILLRERYPAATQIKLPPIPSILSESLVAGGIERILGPGWSAAFGGTRSDLIAKKPRHQPLRIEVKATGANQFQEFKAKDLEADLLIWLHFGPRYRDGTGQLKVYCLRKPGKLFPEPRRLVLSRFLDIAASTPRGMFWHVTFCDVRDALQPARPQV
jgi:hypothetical protein